MKRHIEDPSIAHVARLEHAEMLRELQRRYATGECYFTAREKIMAEHGPRIARAYGQDTAKRALAALTSYGPADMPASIRKAAGASFLAHVEASVSWAKGGTWRYSPLDRLLWRIFGVTLSGPRCVTPGVPRSGRMPGYVEQDDTAREAAEAQKQAERKVKADLRFVAGLIEKGKL
jgi:hypothetical protein